MNNFLYILPLGLNDCLLDLMSDPYTLGHTQNLLKNVYSDLELHVREKKGKIIYNSDTQLCLSIDPEHTDFILDCLFKHINSDAFDFRVGIGKDHYEAITALELSEINKTESVFYYDAETESKILDFEWEFLNKDEKSDSHHGIAIPGIELDSKDNHKPSAKQKTIEALMEIKKLAPELSQIKESAPEIFEAIKKVIDAMISMAEEK